MLSRAEQSSPLIALASRLVSAQVASAALSSTTDPPTSKAVPMSGEAAAIAFFTRVTGQPEEAFAFAEAKTTAGSATVAPEEEEEEWRARFMCFSRRENASPPFPAAADSSSEEEAEKSVSVSSPMTLDASLLERDESDTAV